MYQQVTGNVITLAKSGQYDVLIHGVNCFHTFGAGVAAQVKYNFPKAYDADLETTRGSIHKLGTISYGFHQLSESIQDTLIIANAYTQFEFGRSRRQVNYDAVRSCFRQIKNDLEGLEFLYPAIGAGLAGGDWSIITEIIEEELQGENHTFVTYRENQT